MQQTREELIHWLHDQILAFSSQITIVFDGDYVYGEGSGFCYFPQLVVVYSPRGQSADDYILERISYQSPQTYYTVVSSDQPLNKAARRMGATTRSIVWFLNWLKKKKPPVVEKPIAESPSQLKRLRRIFEEETDI